VSRRVIRKSSRYCDLQASDLLQSLFATEFVCPSEVIWLVSAWISDIPVLDNSDGAFVGINPSWGPRKLRLSETLVALAGLGSAIVVVANEDPHNLAFFERLSAAAAGSGVQHLVNTEINPDLHSKGLVGDDYHLYGSMNFTHNGLTVLTEELVLELDSDHVQRTRFEFQEWYGPRNHEHS
jgi:hypothetical protein